MELVFTLIGNGTWIIEVDKKFKIGCDPALAPVGTKNIYKGIKIHKVRSSVYEKFTFDNVKIWLLTHGHFDHIDKIGLQVIQDSAKVISNKNCAKLLKLRTNLDVSYLGWGEKKNIDIHSYKIEIEAIPAFHGTNLFVRMLLGEVSGYVIGIIHGNDIKKIYVTSDTVYKKEIIEALKRHEINILIANQGNIMPKLPGGPFTMNMKMLDNFIKDLKPDVVIPVHIDDYSHFDTSREELKKRMKVLENGESVTLSI